MHYTYPLKSSTVGWSHSAYIERQNSSWSWIEGSRGYSIWPGRVESADCSSGSKSAWHWPLGGDTHSLPQRPQTGEETLFGSGQRVSVCWHVSSRVRTHEPTLIQTAADLHVPHTHSLSSLSHVHAHHMHTWSESGLKRSKGWKARTNSPSGVWLSWQQMGSSKQQTCSPHITSRHSVSSSSGNKYDFVVSDIDMSERANNYKMKN